MRHEIYDKGLTTRRKVPGSERVSRSLEKLTPFNEEFQAFITRYA